MHHTFEMLRVFAKVWYTAIIIGNCGNRTVVKHGMVFCCLLFTVMLDFLRARTFQSCCLSQSIPVMNFQYWSFKSWVSVLVLDIKVLVLVLVLKLLSLGLGSRLSSIIWGATSNYRFKIGDFASTGAGWPKISGRRGRPPPTILILRKLG